MKPTMKKRHLAGLTWAACAMSAAAAEERGSGALKPNILIIFTDDQGYADLACYGNTKNKTPRLDRLAGEGTRFTNFYAQSGCGPSRSALLTGRYPWLSKGWGMPAHEITFAEKMKEVGYQTACIGKWDVSNRKAIIERMPNAQGFDYYFGTLGANDGGSVAFHENNQPAGKTRDMGSLIRRYTDKSIDYLENQRDPEKPFVLYLAHTMMHTIIDASPSFRGNSAGGLYGDVVEEFDHGTGRLLDKLDELGLRENTLVIYTTDNGPWNQPKYTKRKKGHPEGAIFWGDAGPLRNGKGSCYEGGYRVPCIVRWPGRVPAGRVSDAIFATIDFMPTFATLAGFDVPNDRIIDGIDQTDLLFGKTETGRGTFVYLNNAIRSGKWKYLRAKHRVPGYAVDSRRKQVEELYDLSTNIGETVNIADQHPEVVEELRKSLDEIQKRPVKLKPPKAAAPAAARLRGLIKLKQGSRFAPEVSPHVVGKTLNISARIKSDAPDGVVLAQGGTLVGYSLYLRDGRVIFGVRVNKKLQEITTGEIVTGKQVTVTAKLEKDGSRSVTANGERATASGPAINRQPARGLSVGEDQRENVGRYNKEQFRGAIEDLVLEIQ